jgi:type IV pilus assembly protein PilP
MGWLAGCDGGEAQALRDWIEHERQAAVAPALPPLAEPEVPASAPYRSGEAPDPFDPGRLAAPEPPARGAETVAALAAAPASAPLPADAPLEAYPLEALRMVGSLVREGRTLALVRAQGALHTVRPGDRLGPRDGRVERITERAITLRERVRDATGAWTERSTTLALQETAR